MIFAVLLKSMASTDGSFRGMKFPWEWVVDSFLFLLVMCSSLLYLSYIFEGNQVWCVPSYGPLDAVETFEMFFVASSCKLQLQISLIIYFPYLSSATVTLLMMSHYFWKEIPWIQSKIHLFGTLCLEVMSLDQVFYERDEVNCGILRSFSFSQEQRNLVRRIQIRMFHLLLEPSSLSKYYVLKTSFTSFFCIVFIGVVTAILNKLTFLQSTFYCKIENNYYNKYNNQFSCDISSALPTYAIMLFHALIYVIIFAITLRALWKHYLNPYPLKTINCDELAAEFQSYPGFNDIMFLFAMIQSNVYDGGLLLSNFMKVMLWKEDRKPSDQDKSVNMSQLYASFVPSQSTATLFSGGYGSDSTESTEFVMDSEDESFRFVSATDVKLFYLEALSKYYFEDIHHPSFVVKVVSEESTLKRFNCWSLMHCLCTFHRRIDPLIVMNDYSELAEQLVNEIIKEKEYLLLYTNALRIKKYKKEPLTYKQWFKIITSIDQLVLCCYYAVLAAFSNLYQTSITVITLEENESDVVEIFHPYKTPAKKRDKDVTRHFYIAKAKHLFFVLKRTPTIKNYNTIFDKTYDKYTTAEKYQMKNLLCTYKRRLKTLTDGYDVKKRSFVPKRHQNVSYA